MTEISRITIKKPDLDKLDNDQRKAVESIVNESEKNVVIQANPGSGKTFTLTMAIGNYRYEYINDSICAITFTRAAKADMEDKLHQMGIYDVEVATIHSWAKTRLDKFAKQYDFQLAIIQEPEIKRILKEIIVPEYLLTHRAIRNINIDILYNFISGAKNMDVSDKYKKTLIAIEDRYIKYKKEHNLYDFGDYPTYLLNVMQLYNEYIYDIDALFVDEFQDVDTDQFEVFTRVDTKKKFYIGDIKQSIYQFRSADGKVFDKLEEFKEYNLQYNYRSYQAIIDYSTGFYKTTREAINLGGTSNILSFIHTGEYNGLVTCSRGEGGEIYVIQQHWLTGHCECIKYTEHDVSNVSPNEVLRYILSLQPMILCRTNKQVREISASGLKATTIHQAKGLEYENVILIDFTIETEEDLNVAYVGMTRAENKLMIVEYKTLLELLQLNYKKTLL